MKGLSSTVVEQERRCVSVMREDCDFRYFWIWDSPIGRCGLCDPVLCVTNDTRHKQNFIVSTTCITSKN